MNYCSLRQVKRNKNNNAIQNKFYINGLLRLMPLVKTCFELHYYFYSVGPDEVSSRYFTKAYAIIKNSVNFSAVVDIG